MKKFLLVAILTALAFCANAQEPADTASKQMIICDFPVMPQFPGGDTALVEYLSNNLHYPASEVKLGTAGTVVLRFEVTKTGKVREVKFVRSLSPACDNEAVRVVSSMPDFIPGSENGEPFDTHYILPITFRPTVDTSNKQ